MTNLQGRLGKLLPALSAKERFLIEHRALIADETPDPQVRKTMPSSQVSEFNRYLGLRHAVNVTLGHFITAVALMVDKLTLRFTLMFSVVQLAERVWRLAGLVPAGKHKKAESMLSQSMYSFDLPWDETEKEGTWLDLSDVLFEHLQQETRERWLDMLAIEKVLDEAAGEVDGENLLDPYLQERLGEARASLQGLSALLEEELPELEPNGKQLDDVRQMVQRSRERFG